MSLNLMNTMVSSTQWKNGLVYRIDLVCHLVQRDLLLRYKGSVLGVFWSIGPVLLQLMVLVFLFR